MAVKRSERGGDKDLQIRATDPEERRGKGGRASLEEEKL